MSRPYYRDEEMCSRVCSYEKQGQQQKYRHILGEHEDVFGTAAARRKVFLQHPSASEPEVDVRQGWSIGMSAPASFDKYVLLGGAENRNSGLLAMGATDVTVAVPMQAARPVGFPCSGANFVSSKTTPILREDDISWA